MVTDINDISIGGAKLVAGSHAIINDNFLWCTFKETPLLYFEAVCKAFQKHCVSFKLPQYHFLADRVEYVGHDLLCNGNASVSSKFKLLNDWSVPNSCQTLFSFIRLVAFYHTFAPYHEI